MALLCLCVCVFAVLFCVSTKAKGGSLLGWGRKGTQTHLSLSFLSWAQYFTSLSLSFASHTHTRTLASSRQVCSGAFDARMPPATLFAKPKSNKTPHEHHVLLIVFVRSWAKRWTCWTPHISAAVNSQLFPLLCLLAFFTPGDSWKLEKAIVCGLLSLSTEEMFSKYCFLLAPMLLLVLCQI